MIKQTRSLALNALLLTVAACGNAAPIWSGDSHKESRASGGDTQNGAGGLSLTQPDLGNDYDGVNSIIELTLTSKNDSNKTYSEKFAYKASAAIRLEKILAGPYLLSVRVLDGEDVALYGEQAILVKANQSTRATVELEDVASSRDGNLVVVIKKKSSSTSNACQLASQGIPDICQITKKRLCTYIDVLADGSTKSYEAIQETCGDLYARAQIHADLCEDKRPFKADALICKDVE